MTRPRSDRLLRAPLSLVTPLAIGLVVVTLFFSRTTSAESSLPSASDVRRACAAAPYEECISVATRVFAQASPKDTVHKVTARSVRKACESGHGPSCGLYGAQSDQPRDRVLSSLERGVQLGDPTSLYLLGARRLDDPKAEFATGLAMLETACAKGIADACVRGQAAVRARGGTPSTTFDRALCEASSGEGRAAACERLGRAAVKGGAHDAESLRYLERACLLGQKTACDEAIAALSSSSNAEPRRMNTLLEAACDPERPAHCIAAGEQIEKGTVGVVDLARAASLFDRACSVGEPASCTSLTRLCGRGALPACMALAARCERGEKAACALVPNGSSR